MADLPKGVTTHRRIEGYKRRKDIDNGSRKNGKQCPHTVRLHAGMRTVKLQAGTTTNACRCTQNVLQKVKQAGVQLNKQTQVNSTNCMVKQAEQAVLNGVQRPTKGVPRVNCSSGAEQVGRKR